MIRYKEFKRSIARNDPVRNINPIVDPIDNRNRVNTPLTLSITSSHYNSVEGVSPNDLEL
jgi:hypothetical protein